MTLESFHQYVHSFPEVTEGFPFGPDVLVMKVGGRMFALINVKEPPYFVNLKCDPERAGELRAEYESVRPGYHMNKTHWNSVDLAGDVPGPLLRQLIDHSWDLIVSSLSPADRDRIKSQRDA